MRFNKTQRTIGKLRWWSEILTWEMDDREEKNRIMLDSSTAIHLNFSTSSTQFCAGVWKMLWIFLYLARLEAKGSYYLKWETENRCWERESETFLSDNGRAMSLLQLFINSTKSKVRLLFSEINLYSDVLKHITVEFTPVLIPLFWPYLSLQSADKICSFWDILQEGLFLPPLSRSNLRRKISLWWKKFWTTAR